MSGLRPAVVVVGGLNLDVRAICAGAHVPGDSNPGRIATAPGGVGRNIAAALASFGAGVELVTVLGTDGDSSLLEASCARSGIGLSGVLRSDRFPCSRYVCVLGPDGALVSGVSDMGGIELLDPGALGERATLLDRADAIVVDANIPALSIRWLAERYGRSGEGGARAALPGGTASEEIPGTGERGSPPGSGHDGSGNLRSFRAGPSVRCGRTRPYLFLDPVSATKAERAAPCTGRFDGAKPNRRETEVLSGKSCADMADLRAAAADLRRRGLGEVFASLGPGGIYFDCEPFPAAPGSGSTSGFVRLDREAARLAGRPVPSVEDVTGAGDWAAAALVYGRLAGMEPDRRAAFALAAAAFGASGRGAAPGGDVLDAIAIISRGVIHEPPA